MLKLVESIQLRFVNNTKNQTLTFPYAGQEEVSGYIEQFRGSESLTRSTLDNFRQRQEKWKEENESRVEEQGSSEGEGSGSVREEVQKRLEEGTQNAEEELERVVSEISSRSSSSESSPGEEDQGEIGSESASPEEARSSREEVQQRLEELNRYVVLLWRIVHHGSWFLRFYNLSR